MPEILSQSQIDALLKGLSTGETPAEDASNGDKKSVKDYDFYSPKKFTKEQIRTVDSLHENLARLVSNYFSGVLRVFSEVSVLQVEEQRYFEYNNALPDTALIGLVDLQPINHSLGEYTLMLDMSPNLGFFIVDRLLGGPGDGYGLSRDFTEIELAILDNVYRRLTNYMQDSWRDYLEVECKLDSLETNPRLLQLYAPEDIVVIVVLSVKLRELEGTLSLCIPGIGLEEMMSDFTSKYSRISKKMSDESRDVLRKQVITDALYDSDLIVKAVFDQTVLELSDVLRLRVNDVIPLDRHVNGNVNLFIDDIPWFDGKIGILKNKKAVKITGLFEQ